MFKIFAANPKKTAPVEELLCANREALLTYLERFHGETDDDQTRDELNMILTGLKRLKKKEEGAKADEVKKDGVKKEDENRSATDTSDAAADK